MNNLEKNLLVFLKNRKIKWIGLNSTLSLHKNPHIAGNWVLSGMENDFLIFHNENYLKRKLIVSYETLLNMREYFQ